MNKSCVLFIIFLVSSMVVTANDRVRVFKSGKATRCSLLLNEVDQLKLPFVHVDETPLFTPNEFNQLISLFDLLDSNQVGGFGYGGDKTDLQIRKTPYIRFKFKVNDGKISVIKIFRIDEVQELKGITAEVLKPYLEAVVLRMIQVRPDYKSYFENTERGAAVTFLRYELTPGRKYPNLRWHYDYGTIQAITPVNLPDGLLGAHLQIQKKPYFNHFPVLDITPKENHTVIFDNMNAWHRVTPFIVPGNHVGSGPLFRDIFTVEIYSDPENIIYGKYKNQGR